VYHHGGIPDSTPSAIGLQITQPGGSGKIRVGVLMPWVIAWIIAVCVGVVCLTIAFVNNARRLRRDLNQRRDVFRARLENDANAMIDHLLSGRRAKSQNHQE
jgi:ABC-type transport system involved in cytochrome bd biosynthesis fused ATPase/permease subunit